MRGILGFMNNSNKKVLFDEQERNLVESVRPKKTIIQKKDSANVSSSHTKIVVCSVMVVALLIIGLIVMSLNDLAGAIILAMNLILCLSFLVYIIYCHSRDYSVVYADNGEIIEYSGKEIKRNYPQYYKRHQKTLILVLISALAVLVFGIILGIHVISSYNSRDWNLSATIWTIVLSIEFVSSIILLIVSIIKTNKLYDNRPKPTRD